MEGGSDDKAGVAAKKANPREVAAGEPVSGMGHASVGAAEGFDLSLDSSESDSESEKPEEDFAREDAAAAEKTFVDKPVELLSGHGPSVIIRISPLPWGLSGIFSRSSRPSSQTCCKCRELWSCNQARKHTHRHWPIFVESGPLPVDKPVAVDRRRAVTQHLN